MKWNRVTLTGTMRTVKMVRSEGYTQNKRERDDKAAALAAEAAGRMLLRKRARLHDNPLGTGM